MNTTSVIKIGFTVVAMLLSQLSLASNLVPAPASVEQYMASSDVVVKGRIGEAVKVHRFYGYQGNAAELERRDAGTHMSFGIPMVDYVVEIEEVLSDSGSMLTQMDSVILRVFRDHDHKDVLEEIEDAGNFLLFLTLNPDDKTFGLYSLGHKVNIDGQKPVFKVVGEEFEVLGGSVSSTELISAVRSHN